MARRKVKFGVIGLGLMGKEFGSAVGRWYHLVSEGPVPEIVGVCDTNPAAHPWFTENFPSVTIATTDYHELLASREIEAVYCAVPHNLHEPLYVDILKAGKHLMGEKPFGIDQKANAAILAEAARHPELVVRCSSEFPFFPACQRLIAWARAGRFGRILEVRSGFHHSSDMDVNKPINWKRMVEVCGEYGCLGDLGIHMEHVPFRLGWLPKSVYGVLSKIVTERPDGKGGVVPCRTWDNATLVCQVDHPNGYGFPMIMETKRMAPGATNTWFLEVYGLNGSARFTTQDPKSFYFSETVGKEQPWSRVDLGYTPMIPGITGGIFEFGFPDAILQMWGAFLEELDGRTPAFGCFTPEETRWSHALQTAALVSHRKQSVEPVGI
ncbi:MAG: Gfo/Idh/MocA family oxidoreductase [Spirochaetales bacterium]|nr:Gfo/Idh/MocA family oxidoreductase [Spirochaetales bacterium]